MVEKEILYSMNLHGVVEFMLGGESYIVTRVPGGWIYEMKRGNTKRVTSVFVPFDNEFQEL